MITMKEFLKAKKIIEKDPRQTVPCPWCGRGCYVIIREEVSSMACAAKKGKKAVKKMKK